ncbi:MAG: hypothetical protein MHMPM18_002174 [Marteilia pararefringens]
MRSCLRRSDSHRGDHPKEDYPYFNDFKSLEEKPSDKAISCEYSGEYPGKMDSNLVRKNLKEPKDFFKDFIYSSNEDKPQSTDVKCSPQSNRRGHDIETDNFLLLDQQNRPCSTRSNSFKQAISPEDYSRNNDSKSLEGETSDMASVFGNSGGRGNMIDSKLVRENLFDSNDSSEDSIQSPKDYKPHSTDVKKPSQYNHQGHNVVPDQHSRSFSRQSNSHGHGISPVDYPHNNDSKSLEGGTSDMTSTSDNSDWRHRKIKPKRVQFDLSDSNDYPKDSIQSLKQHKPHSTDFNKSLQHNWKGHNVVPDQFIRSCLRRSDNHRQGHPTEDYPYFNDFKSLEEKPSDKAISCEYSGESPGKIEYNLVQKNLRARNDFFKDLIHSSNENKPQSTDDKSSPQGNERGHDIVTDQQNKSFPRRFNSIEEGKESVETSTSENSGGSHGKIDFKQVRENLKKPKNFSKDSIHSSNEHKLQSTNVTTSSQDDRKEQNVASDTEGDISKLDGKNMREASRKLYSRINEKKENQIRESNKIISGSRV